MDFVFWRNIRYKGLEYLLMAEPLIDKRFSSVRIVIAGKGQQKYYRYLRNRDRYILINRYITYKEAALLFQKSCMVVLPYVCATVSGIPGTAYAFKKPVIATKIGGFPEIIDDGKTGILVPPRDPKALAEAITTLLENSEKRKKMGEAGFVKLKTELSWDTTVDKLIDLYRRLLN